jgi:hypothetical protein
MDRGFVYYRSFEDLDGHMWEVLWMSQEAIERGPADMAQTAQRQDPTAARVPPPRAGGRAPRRRAPAPSAAISTSASSRSS